MTGCLLALLLAGGAGTPDGTIAAEAARHGIDDKALHLVAGAGLAYLVNLQAAVQPPPERAEETILAGGAFCGFIGVVKEEMDLDLGGEFDVADLGMTVVGCMGGTVLSLMTYDHVAASVGPAGVRLEVRF